MAHARLLLKTGRLYQGLVPGALAHLSRVANIKSGIVVIHAETGAAAAKIKQIAGRLAGELMRKGVECNGIEVRVQPKTGFPPEPDRSQRTLSSKAASSLEKASELMPAGSRLRAAIDALVTRSAR